MCLFIVMCALVILSIKATYLLTYLQSECICYTAAVQDGYSHRSVLSSSVRVVYTARDRGVVNDS